jgi:hypothetical protein
MKKNNTVSKGLDWPVQAKNLAKSQIYGNGMDFNILSNELSNMGIKRTPDGLRRTVNSGTIPLKVFLQIVSAAKNYAGKNYIAEEFTRH